MNGFQIAYEAMVALAIVDGKVTKEEAEACKKYREVSCLVLRACS